MIQNEARELLGRLIGCWFPRCVEPVGFHQTFDRAWNPLKDDGQFLVFQARMTWAAASSAEALPERRAELEGHARHGLQCLQDSFWDSENGGFHWFAPPISGVVKQLYGLAFALYALAACARVLGDSEIKAQAESAFDWIDQHLHDDEFGGYLEACTWDGTPAALTGKGPPVWKTLNAQMHLFEALLELFRSLPSPRLRTRIEEMLDVFLVRLYQESGKLHNRTVRDWTPASDRWEIGHDLEVAYLLLFAEEVLAESPTGLESKATALIDRCLEDGFDDELGGVYEWATFDGKKFDAKGWWPQMEGLNALILAAKRWPDGGYEKPLARQWSWIRDRQWDAENGGFWGTVSRTGILLDDGRKGHAWKAAYHDTRALLNLMKL